MKAKGRGKGLQDEKMKPGKGAMKANKGNSSWQLEEPFNQENKKKVQYN